MFPTCLHFPKAVLSAPWNSTSPIPWKVSVMLGGGFWALHKACSNSSKETITITFDILASTIWCKPQECVKKQTISGYPCQYSSHITLVGLTTKFRGFKQINKFLIVCSLCGRMRYVGHERVKHGGLRLPVKEIVHIFWRVTTCSKLKLHTTNLRREKNHYCRPWSND